MGREAACTARLAGAGPRQGSVTSTGKALLETVELLFRGDFRVAVPFKEMTDIRADASELTVTWPGGTLVLGLGAAARAWAERIRNPPGRLDKLGVKATSVTTLVGGGRAGEHPDLDEFVAEVEARGAKIGRGNPDARVDLVFACIERREDVRVLARLRRAMRPDAAIWVLRPKGKGAAAVSEAEVRAAAKAAGLVDVKVAAFSPSWTAEKLVIPLAERGARPIRAKAR
jgi:Protein of unknown function (DUF3052)